MRHSTKTLNEDIAGKIRRPQLFTNTLLIDSSGFAARCEAGLCPAVLVLLFRALVVCLVQYDAWRVNRQATRAMPAFVEARTL